MGSSHEDAAIAQTQSEPTHIIIYARSVTDFDRRVQQSRKANAYLHHNCRVTCVCLVGRLEKEKHTFHLFTALLRK
jgi:hypothetical protein